MDNPQLHPLEIHPKTGECYLRLRAHRNIIITPFRPTDAPALITVLNDPKVHIWLERPPYPYTQGTVSLRSQPRSDQLTKHR